MKKAFTLAEVMIVLAIIGILTAILLPVARNAMPNEDIIKFKKAHNTLNATIRELATSDKYYLNGDLGIKSTGEKVEEYTYFCNTISEILNCKRKNCSTHISPHADTEHIVQIGSEYGIDLEIAKNVLDSNCKKYESIIGSELELQDGIVFFQTHPNYPFGMKYKSALENLPSDDLNYGYCDNYPYMDICQDDFRLFGTDVYVDENGFDRIYKVICMDIDGVNRGENPFGYGVRADGKIVNGARADEWLNKSIQNKD